MATRCASCNKFTSLEFQDPEVTSELELDDGEVCCEIRIVRSTECCGEEAKEAAFEMSEEIPPEVTEAHSGDGHELSAEADDPERVEESGGRYKKSYFGASVGYRVTCSCQEGPVHEGTLSDKVAASEMEDLL